MKIDQPIRSRWKRGVALACACGILSVTTATPTFAQSDANPSAAAASDTQHLAEWLERLGDPRFYANGGVPAFVNLGADARLEAVPGLLENLRAEDAVRRRHAARILNEYAQLDPGAIVPALVPGLIEQLRHDSSAVRVTALELLGNLGSRALDDAVPALIGMLAHEDADTLRAAIVGLGQIAQRHPEAVEEGVPALIEGLHHADAPVRNAAGVTLARIGQAALPAIVASLQGENVAGRAAAFHALLDVGKRAPDAVLSHLLELLRDEQAANRAHAAGALRAQYLITDTRNARSAIVEALIRALEDPDPQVQLQAIHALRAVPARYAALAAPVLTQLQNSDNARVALAASQALSLLGTYSAASSRVLGEAGRG